MRCPWRHKRGGATIRFFISRSSWWGWNGSEIRIAASPAPFGGAWRAPTLTFSLTLIRIDGPRIPTCAAPPAARPGIERTDSHVPLDRRYADLHGQTSLLVGEVARQQLEHPSAWGPLLTVERSRGGIGRRWRGAHPVPPVVTRAGAGAGCGCGTWRAQSPRAGWASSNAGASRRPAPARRPRAASPADRSPATVGRECPQPEQLDAQLGRAVQLARQRVRHAPRAERAAPVLGREIAACSSRRPRAQQVHAAAPSRPSARRVAQQASICAHSALQVSGRWSPRTPRLISQAGDSRTRAAGARETDRAHRTEAPQSARCSARPGGAAARAGQCGSRQQLSARSRPRGRSSTSSRLASSAAASDRLAASLAILRRASRRGEHRGRNGLRAARRSGIGARQLDASCLSVCGTWPSHR